LAVAAASLYLAVVT